MQKNIQDIVGGLFMLAVGLFVAVYAGKHYELGDINQMGPAFFPVGLGALLAMLGAAIAAQGWVRSGPEVKIQWRSWVLVPASMMLFAFLVRPLGVVLATLLSVWVSSLANRHTTHTTRAVLAAVIALMVWLVFVKGLGMQLPAWPWSL